MAVRSALYTVNGQRITDTDLNRGLRINIICGCMAMCWLTISQGIPMTMLMENLSASGTVTGLIFALQQIAMVVQIPAAVIAERLPERKPFFAATNMVNRAMWILPAFLPLFMPGGSGTTAAIILVAIAISSIFAQMATAPWMSWMADLVPESRRGSFWGRRQSLCMAVYLLALLVAGRVLDAFPGSGDYRGFSIVFGFGALMGILDILLHTRVPEPRPSPPKDHEPVLRRIRALWSIADYRRLTLSFAMWSFGVSIPGSFAVVYLRRVYQTDYVDLTLLVVASSLSIALSGSIWGTIQDRLGGRAFGVLMMFLAPLAVLSWFFIAPPGEVPLGRILTALPLIGTGAEQGARLLGLADIALAQPVWLVLGVNFIFAAFYGGLGLAQLDLLSRLTAKEGRTLAMALHWTIIGVFAAAGSAFGGVIVDYVTAHPLPETWTTLLGQRLGFIHVLVVFHLAVTWCVAIPFLLRVTKLPKEASVTQAFSTLFARNPFRTMGAVYNIYAVGAPRPSHERARAVRELGESRSEIAVADLIEKLDDPSSTVREEAIFALGRIASPRAIDALLAKLEDPHSDLAPQIARALRERPSPRSLSTVIRRMSQPDPDRETKSELARTLGAIGDTRAVPLLMRTLQMTTDPKIISASSDALAGMGELAAIYEIVPHMKATRNPVLKRSLAVAVGNLLGEPDGFYVVLNREQKEPGRESERMLAGVRRHIEALSAERFPAQGRSLVQRLDPIRAALEKEDFREALQLLFDLSLGFAGMLYGVEHGPDARAMMEHIVWRGQKYGIGIWFMNLLLERDVDTPPEDKIDAVDFLLALYFLHHHMHGMPGS